MRMIFCSALIMWIAFTGFGSFGMEVNKELNELFNNAVKLPESSEKKSVAEPLVSDFPSEGVFKLDVEIIIADLCAEYLPDYYTCTADVKKIIEKIQSTPCTNGCLNHFSTEWTESVDTVIDALKPTEDLFILGNILDMLIQGDLLSKEQKEIVQNAVVGLSGVREDLSMSVNLNHKAMFPALNAAPGIQRKGGFSSVVVDRNVGEWDSLNLKSPVSVAESKIDYFREDDDFNVFHEKWHNNNRKRHPQNRKFERFSSMHRIMLNRYLTGRRVEEMDDITPLSANERDRAFSTEYNRLERNTEKITNGRIRCFLNENAKQTLKRLEDTVNRELRSIEIYNRELETTYHNSGHNYIGSCGPMMWHTEVSARMPIFWRWHLEIDVKYQEYLDQYKPPVTRGELIPPQGITIEEAFITSRCKDANNQNAKNLVETYWNEYYNIQFNYDWYSLAHHPVKFHIILNNARKSNRKVIVRIFLGLDEFWETTKWYFEMDRFVWKLKGNTREEIIRDENMSSSTYHQGYNKCGWPQKLYLPKGRFNKPVKYRMLVFVNDVDQRVTEGEDEKQKGIMCGIFSESGGLVDSREHGFPLARPWESNLKNRILSNQDGQIGNVATVIQIVHTGLESDQCDLGLFENTTTTTTTTTTRTIRTTISTTPFIPTTTTTTTTTTRTIPTTISTTTMPMMPCKGFLYNGLCYWTSDTRVSAYSAQRFCQSQGGGVVGFNRLHIAVQNWWRAGATGQEWFWESVGDRCRAIGIKRFLWYAKYVDCRRTLLQFQWETKQIYALCIRKVH